MFIQKMICRENSLKAFNIYLFFNKYYLINEDIKTFFSLKDLNVGISM